MWWWWCYRFWFLLMRNTQTQTKPRKEHQHQNNQSLCPPNLSVLPKRRQKQRERERVHALRMCFQGGLKWGKTRLLLQFWKFSVVDFKGRILLRDVIFALCRIAALSTFFKRKDPELFITGVVWRREGAMMKMMMMNFAFVVARRNLKIKYVFKSRRIINTREKPPRLI